MVLGPVNLHLSFASMGHSLGLYWLQKYLMKCQINHVQKHECLNSRKDPQMMPGKAPYSNNWCGLVGRGKEWVFYQLQSEEPSRKSFHVNLVFIEILFALNLTKSENIK